MGEIERFFQARYEQARAARGLGTEDDDERLIRQRLGTFDSGIRGKPITLERVACPGYTRERIELSVLPGLTFKAYVLVPDGPGPFHSLLAVHGHGYGSREIVGLPPDGGNGPVPVTGHRQFAVSLVRRGLLVVAPDVLGFGERRFEAEAKGDTAVEWSCYLMAARLLLEGKTLAGLRVAEAEGCLDYIKDRGDVIPRTIGAFGFSGGSLIAAYLAILRKEISAIVLSGFANTFRESIMSVKHCIDNYVPGILAIGEQPELLSLLAPRPLFLEGGSEDPIFPKKGFMECVDVVGRAYAKAGAEERFGWDLFKGTHEVSGGRSFDWIANELKGMH
jgi:pimeloyl-ACP methyl ester carboxylesterase